MTEAAELKRLFDDNLIDKWSGYKEHLETLLANGSFNIFQSMIQDLINNLNRFGLDRNSQNREEDYNTICEKRGNLSAYYEILELPSAVISQIQEIAEEKKRKMVQLKGDKK